MISDYIGYWVLDALELREGTWHLESFTYDSVDEALDDVELGFEERDLLPICLAFHDNGASVVMNQFEVFSAAFDFTITRVCLDHGAPYCPCVTGVEHQRPDV